MFNTYEANNKVNINAVSGTLIKSYRDSFFIRLHIRSNLADDIFSKDPQYLHHKDNGWKVLEPIVILQTMLCGDGELIVEVMWKKDFDKLFEGDVAKNEEV